MREILKGLKVIIKLNGENVANFYNPLTYIFIIIIIIIKISYVIFLLSKEALSHIMDECSKYTIRNSIGYEYRSWKRNLKKEKINKQNKKNKKNK
jgi:hypothetical protein